jgi:hypothetical protein
VLVAVERLLVKLRQPASRARELIELRQRLRAERALAVDDEERALARRVLEEKLAVGAALGEVSACGGCATGLPRPLGDHDGGACCAGNTADLFDDAELAALAGAGTRPRDLTPPGREHPLAGCAFRGAEGCSLSLAHRPARCVHYTCEELRRELHRRGDLDGILARLDELDRAMQRFTGFYRGRADRDVVAPVLDAVRAATATTRASGASGGPRSSR